MVVMCAHCNKRYHLDDLSLGHKGRLVRCAACTYTWFQIPKEGGGGGSESVSPLTPSQTAFPKPRWGYLVSKVAVFLALVLIFGVGIGGKNFVVSYVPQAIPFYEALGLSTAPAAAPLEIRHMKIQNIVVLGQENGRGERLILSGDVVNRSPYIQSVPPLKIRFLSTCEPQNQLQGTGQPFEQNRDQHPPHKFRVTHTFWHTLSQSEILPGEIVHFEVSFEPELPTPETFTVEF